MKSPRDLGLPYDDWRPGQRLAIRTALHGKAAHIVINAPTGAGKSTMAAALPQLQPSKRHVTLTATKGLQDQYSGTFKHLVDLRGMSNYECRAAKDQFRSWFGARRLHVNCDDGPCHAGVTCELKSGGCDYFDARSAFVASHAGLTNYAAWLANRRWAAAVSPLGEADRLICDEAHDLPEQLMSAYRVDIPEHLFDSRKIPTTLKGWKLWAEQKLGELKPGEDDDSRLRRSKIEKDLRQLANMDREWAWDRDREGVHFEPTIPRTLFPLLGAGASQVIYLSATITPATMRLLDVESSEIEFLTMKSLFPLAHRPIYVLPGVRVDYRSMQHPDRVALWLDKMSDFIDARDDRRGIIHSVSFDRAWQIGLGVRDKRRMVIHKRGESAGDVVRRFRSAGSSAVLVSPSVTTGFDFAYLDAEFNIIPKLPFPDTTSRIMKARVKATDRYRDHMTMTRLVQACGRIVRAEDDQGETAIFDEHFKWWYRENRDLAPDWFDEALIITRKQVRPLPKLRRVA